MSATTQLMTADELLNQPRGKLRYELVKGELRTMSPSGFEHGAVVVNLTFLLTGHVKAHELGVVVGAETGFKISSDPDTVRAPDIAFVCRERIVAAGVTRKFWSGAPDLAVEVLSPGDRVNEIDEKVAEWLAAGTRLVWVVNPRLRNVTIYRSLTDVRVLTEGEELDGGDVVPGFRCRVAEIFV